MAADLTTSYLGLNLRTPLVASASPLSQSIDRVRRLEDVGASAIVLWSLFEEQLRNRTFETGGQGSGKKQTDAESLAGFSKPGDFHFAPEEYLDHIRRSKQAVSIPVIASLNGVTTGGWTQYAREIQQAGADALECNIYSIPTDPDLSSAQVEQTYVDILQAVKSATSIPVAVKLFPYFSNMASMAKRLDEAGAAGLVLFNRFYQSDIDLETMAMKPEVLLSTTQALRLPLTWIGILYGRVRAALAASSGIDKPEDVVKLLLVGASVTMLCSTLMRNGVKHLQNLEQGLRDWMERHNHQSVREMQGSMSHLRCPDPTAFERNQYLRAVKDVQHVMVTGREAWRILTGE